MALAGRLNAWAAALDGVAAVPDLSARLAESERLLQESLDIYSRMASTVFELDEARQRNDAAAIATAQLRVDDITARYRQAMDARPAAQHALVGDIRVAASDPVVIAPRSNLLQYGLWHQTIEFVGGTFRLSGSDLVLAISREQAKINYVNALA